MGISATFVGAIWNTDASVTYATFPKTTLMNGLKMMHVIHKWTKWVFDRRIQRFDEYDQHYRTDTRFIRRCEKCGKPQIMRLKGGINQVD